MTQPRTVNVYKLQARVEKIEPHPTETGKVILHLGDPLWLQFTSDSTPHDPVAGDLMQITMEKAQS